MKEESEYTDEEVKEAMTFIIRDNPTRKWKSQDEFFEAVNNYLLENTVISNLEELIKDGMVKEISPNQFVPTEKGLKLLRELEKEKEK